jgi:hypothetical protein
MENFHVSHVSLYHLCAPFLSCASNRYIDQIDDVCPNIVN